MKNSFSHHALSPEPFCVLRSVHQGPSGIEEVVCVLRCMHACWPFASASGNVLLRMCACTCVVLLTENSLEGASQMCKCCQNPPHTPTGAIIINTLVRGYPDVGPV